MDSALDDRSAGILSETFVGNELVSKLITRDDLFCWKSENKAEVEFLLKSPCVGIDVKTASGNVKSLNSLALMEPTVSCLIKVYNGKPLLERKHRAKLPTSNKERTLPLISIPHYLTSRIFELIKTL
jgi:hypothetical protein